MVFSSLIGINEILTNDCGNLSTHHYHLAYHPCFNRQFRHGQTTQQYFHAVAMSSRKKRKRLSCSFVPKESGKKKENCVDKDWADQHATSHQGSQYEQQEFKEGQVWKKWR